MTRAIYPGSFDPITLGHMNIIERASKMVDELIVGVLVNKKKSSLFSTSTRVEMIKDATKHLSNVKVIDFDGLLVDYAKENGIQLIVRGLRAVTDFEYELQIAQTNRELSKNTVDTIFLTTDVKYSFMSSSAVREIASFGGKLDGFVTAEVEQRLRRKFSIDLK